MEDIIVEPSASAEASVIWLHGLGADGHDFAGILPMLGLPENHAIRFIFPHAPMRPITINDGMVMRGWYDITNLDLDRKSDHSDPKGIEESVKQITKLIENEISQGITANKIVLAGFSQGGVIALHSALRYQKPLASVLALSTYLPIAEKIPEATIDYPTEIFAAHGTEDSVVPYNAGESAKYILEDKGYKTTWHTYPMDHAVCADEITEIGGWITRKLSDNRTVARES